MAKEPSGEDIRDVLGIAKERQEAVTKFCQEAIKEATEHGKLNNEGTVIKHIVEQAFKQEFTTTELAMIAYKIGAILEILYPNPYADVLRAIQQFKSQE